MRPNLSVPSTIQQAADRSHPEEPSFEFVRYWIRPDKFFVGLGLYLTFHLIAEHFILCSDCIFGYFIKREGVNQGENRFLVGFSPLGSRVMFPILVLCSHCIKMRICYSRIFRTSSSGASNFPKSEFLIIFDGVTAFMSPAPGSIWTVWETRRSLHTSRIWQRTTGIGKYKLTCHDRNLNFRGEIAGRVA